MNLTGARGIRHRAAPTGGDRSRILRPYVRPPSNYGVGRSFHMPDKAPEPGGARGWYSPMRSRRRRHRAPEPWGSRQPGRSARRTPMMDGDAGASAEVGTPPTTGPSRVAKPPGPTPNPSVAWPAKP